MPITVLDPTNEPIKAAFDRAPRPKSLENLTLGFIDNSKKNSDYLVKKIGALLKERYEVKTGPHVRKPSPSHGISEDLATDLARQADLVLAGIGD